MSCIAKLIVYSSTAKCLCNNLVNTFEIIIILITYSSFPGGIVSYMSDLLSSHRDQKFTLLHFQLSNMYLIGILHVWTRSRQTLVFASCFAWRTKENRQQTLANRRLFTFQLRERLLIQLSMLCPQSEPYTFKCLAESQWCLFFNKMTAMKVRCDWRWLLYKAEQSRLVAVYT